MAARDDIADRAREGDVEGVLKIYDIMNEDRERVRALNDAYLAEIRRLAGSKPDMVAPPAKGGKGDALTAYAAACGEATAARRAVTATLGAP